MRKLIFAALLCGFCFYAAAQTSPPALIYVSPITGAGSADDDNQFIFSLVSNEIRLNGLSIAREERRADYLLAGSIAPYDDSNWHFEQLFVLNLSLENARTGIFIVEQDVIYGSQEDLRDIFPRVMQGIFGALPAQDDGDAWRNKWLYTGLYGFWSPRTYNAQWQQTNYIMNFGGGFEAEFHFLKFLSVGAGVEITTDWIMEEPNYGMVLGFPLLVKGVLKPHSYYMLELYAGIQFDLSLHYGIKPSAFSFLAGFQYGVNIGPGVFFIDPRFSIDLADTILYGLEEHPYRRYMINIGMGYKIGFFSRGKK